MNTVNQIIPSITSDAELLAAITRDLRAVYSDVIKQPLPQKLSGTLQRLEQLLIHTQVGDLLRENVPGPVEI